MDQIQNLFRNLTLVDLAVTIAWIILLLPAVFYLFTSWKNRRDLLFGRLGSGAIKLYYKQFFPNLKPSADSATRKARSIEQLSEEEIFQQFRRDFGRLYGRRHFVLPLLLVAVISLLGFRATSQSVQAWLSNNQSTAPYPPIVISAFLGGYAWVLYDHFRRFRTGDFTSHDIYAAVYRFLIAVPLGISIAAFLKDEVGIGVAFLLAAFPTAALLTLTRRLASQKLGLGESGESGTLELEKLQCVGRANAERYVDEGISTIAELAWADPIALTIKTNLEFNFVIDSVSQALMWVYFEDRVKKLYPLSLRGAQEVCAFLNDLDSDEAKVKAAANKNLAAAAALIGLDPDSFLYTLISVRDDPYAQFLFEIWA